MMNKQIKIVSIKIACVLRKPQIMSYTLAKDILQNNNFLLKLIF